MSDTKACPYCAEEILSAAVKCKHCGEFIEVARAPGEVATCPVCGIAPGSKGLSVLGHLKRAHGMSEGDAKKAAQMAGMKVVERVAPTPNARPEAVKHKRLSDVGLKGAGGPSCPVCGGSQFTVKRSKKAKVFLGVASLVVKGSQVRCVACGTIYKRG